MTFSDTVAQQREKQAKALGRFVTASLAGSIALHGGGLFLRTSDLWKQDEPSEEITIIVTEDELESPVNSEETLTEPTAEPQTASEFAAPEAVAQPFSEPVAVAPAPPIEPTVEEPVPEEEPTPAPLVEEPTPEPAEAPEAPTETAAETPAEPSPDPNSAAPRSLSDLLLEIRRQRQQSATGGQSDAVETGNPAAQSSGASQNSSGSNAGSNAENSAGNGAPTAAAPTRPEPIAPPASRGSQSREISCRGCDFDYPDEADGAEGTAQVVVETDSEGHVVAVTLSRSSGNAALDQAALEQARQRVRLNNARSGESYPIEIDFVQPNSEAARRTRERGDRRSITVSEPEPVIETPAPAAATTPAPDAAADPTVAPTAEPTASPEPSVATPESSPSSPALPDLPSSDPVAEPVPEPEVIAEPELPPEPDPISEFESTPLPEPEPEPIPEPVFESVPKPVTAP